jgi:hypothetical protein
MIDNPMSDTVRRCAIILSCSISSASSVETPINGAPHHAVRRTRSKGGGAEEESEEEEIAAAHGQIDRVTQQIATC